MARPKAKKDDGPEEEMLTLQDAARALGVSRSTLQRMLRQGNVRGFKVGRQWRFRRSDLDKFAQTTHPSAAGVNVSQLEGFIAELGASPQEVARLVLGPPPSGYPTTEGEKAIDGLLRALLASAAKAGASDIHVEPSRDGTTVRLRIDGVLHEAMRLPRSAHDALVACIKVHTEIPVDQRNLPQDGRFSFRLEGADRDVRVATIPSIYGESVVMRLLAQEPERADLDRLGMQRDDRARYERALRAPCGLLVATGPTGSGKTTVLYSGLRHIADPELKILSVEDPVECSFRHVTQVAVNRKAGLTFEAAQRAFMRQDPDVMMVGEIRTLEGAELSLQAALTGHLVMTVLHARTAAGAVTRLLDMGIEPFMLAEALIYVSSQRLARKVCPKCAQPDKPDFGLLSPLAERARAGGYSLPENPKFMHGAGCERCRQTGYHGRTGIYETIEVTREIQRLIAHRADAKHIQEAAIRGGTTTLAADGLRKAADGITTVAEVARVVPPEET